MVGAIRLKFGSQLETSSVYALHGCYLTRGFRLCQSLSRTFRVNKGTHNINAHRIDLMCVFKLLCDLKMLLNRANEELCK